MAFEKYLLTKNNFFTENYATDFYCDNTEELGWIPVEFIPKYDYWLKSSLVKMTHKDDGSVEVLISMYDEYLNTEKEHALSIKVGDKLEIAAAVAMDCPGYEYIPLVVEVSEIFESAFSLVVIGIDKEYCEEDDEEEPFEFELGEEICFLPKDAIYSVEVSLEKITRTTEGCVMSILVKDPDGNEDKTYDIPIKVGDVIEMDELVPGVVCFIGPDRETVELKILEIAENYVSVRKINQ